MEESKRHNTMSTLANEINLEDRAETIFEDMMKSFLDLSEIEERLVYKVACMQARQETE